MSHFSLYAAPGTAVHRYNPDVCEYFKRLSSGKYFNYCLVREMVINVRTVPNLFVTFYEAPATGSEYSVSQTTRDKQWKHDQDGTSPREDVVKRKDLL